MLERMAVANLALHGLAGIDYQSRETLEYIKHEDARSFEISMSTVEKTFKGLSARRNSIARSLWMAKTKSCVAKLSLIKRNKVTQFSKLVYEF